MKFSAIVCVFFLVSCSTRNHMSQRAGGVDVSVKSQLSADVDVDMTRKIVGKATHVRIFGIHTQSSRNYAEGVTYQTEGNGGGMFGLFGPGMEEEAKSAAAYNATVPSKADILVAPQYLVKVKSYFFGAYKEVQAQVWGYAGKIRDIKQK